MTKARILLAANMEIFLVASVLNPSLFFVAMRSSPVKEFTCAAPGECSTFVLTEEQLYAYESKGFIISGLDRLP